MQPGSGRERESGPGAGQGTHVRPAEPFGTDRICRLEHDVHRHPLLQLDALHALARELEPAGGCRFLAPGAVDSSAFDHAASSHDGRTLDDVIARIEEPGSWIALYNVEQVPRCAAVLRQVVDGMRALVEREQPDIFLVTGFVFISAPPSVTPYHIDRENNLWLQLRGRKTLAVWDHRVTPAPVVEEFIVHRDLGGVRLTDDVRAQALEFEAGPGDGLYFPATTPHMTRSTRDWVRPGDGVAISIGINFYTRVTRRRALAHQANRLLRRAGLDPRRPGQSAWVDAVKMPLGALALEWLARRRTGYVEPPGMRMPR